MVGQSQSTLVTYAAIRKYASERDDMMARRLYLVKTPRRDEKKRGVQTCRRIEKELCTEGRDACVKCVGCVLAAEHVGVYMGLRGLVV